MAKLFVRSCKVGRDSYRWPLFRLEVACDQARSLIKAQIGPGPLEEHRQAIAKTDKEEHVDEQPDEPRRKTAEVQKIQIGHGLIPANRGHAALVPIPESLRLTSRDD